MSTDVIVALVTGAFTLAGVIVTVIVGNKNTAKQIKDQSELTLYRIQQLEKKQDAHNTLIERMYAVEDKVNIHDEKIRVANHRIDDLEHRGA